METRIDSLFETKLKAVLVLARMPWPKMSIFNMHKSKYNLAPEYIKSFFLPNDLVHDKPLEQRDRF